MTLRAKLAARAQELLEKRARAKLFKNQEIRTFLEKVVSPSTGCQYSDYWLLYSYVVKYKPREILELGSGISTVILAIAAKENGVSKITSMDESEHYLSETKRVLPSSLSSYVSLHYSPSESYAYGPFTGVVYANVPKKNYDLIFVDGPQYDPHTTFDADIVKIAQEQEHEFTYIVDSRTGSCFLYHHLFTSPFRFDYLKRKGFGKGGKKILRSYPEIVAYAMKRRLFPRVWL